MKTDRFTKILLSIIAAALVVIAVNMTMPARATDDLVRVDIARVDGKLVFEAVPVRMVGK